jgi:hypothetical protein
MKNTVLALLSLLLAAPLYASSGEHLIPAGSLISCTVAEPKISSKTTAVGDPVLCQVGHSERYGRSSLPMDSYLVGRFEDYKNPGHFVGKGWMELRFDRMVIEPNTVIPIDARVVDVPGYKVDNQGRILGKGHVARDVVMWSIPVLWPVDLLMLPMRGPRPTLKEETRLTLKVMDDLGVPATEPQQRDPYGLIQRQPSAYNDMPPPPAPEQAPYPDQSQYQDQTPMPVAENYPPPMQAAPPPAYAYAPPPAYYGYAAPPVYAYIAPPAVRYGYGYGVAPGVRYGYGAPLARGYAYGGRPAPAPRYAYGAATLRAGATMRAPSGMMAMRGGARMSVRGR